MGIGRSAGSARRIRVANMPRIDVSRKVLYDVLEALAINRFEGAYRALHDDWSRDWDFLVDANGPNGWIYEKTGSPTVTEAKFEDGNLKLRATGPGSAGEQSIKVYKDFQCALPPGVFPKMMLFMVTRHTSHSGSGYSEQRALFKDSQDMAAVAHRRGASDTVGIWYDLNGSGLSNAFGPHTTWAARDPLVTRLEVWPRNIVVYDNGADADDVDESYEYNPTGGNAPRYFANEIPTKASPLYNFRVELQLDVGQSGTRDVSTMFQDVWLTLPGAREVK